MDTKGFSSEVVLVVALVYACLLALRLQSRWRASMSEIIVVALLLLGLLIVLPVILGSV